MVRNGYVMSVIYMTLIANQSDVYVMCFQALLFFVAIWGLVDHQKMIHRGYQCLIIVSIFMAGLGPQRNTSDLQKHFPGDKAPLCDLLVNSCFQFLGP